MSIICLGELIIDFIPLETGKQIWQVERFKKSVGGAPANVAIGLQFHQVPVTFWSKVGKDSFGQFLKHQLQELGLSVSGIADDQHHRTKLAFVGIDDEGERSFEFHNLDSAERYILSDDLNLDEFSNANIFHFGGVALLGDVTAETTFTLLKEARKQNCLVSFDPNIRLDLAGHPESLNSRIRKAIQYVDILKLNWDEYQMIFGNDDPANVVRDNISLLIITEGNAGSHFFTKKLVIDIPAVKTNVVDTTGAGDAFMAAVLTKLNEKKISDLSQLTETQIRDIGNFASEWAGKCINFPGAITVYLNR